MFFVQVEVVLVTLTANFASDVCRFSVGRRCIFGREGQTRRIVRGGGVLNLSLSLSLIVLRRRGAVGGKRDGANDGRLAACIKTSSVLRSFVRYRSDRDQHDYQYQAEEAECDTGRSRGQGIAPGRGIMAIGGEPRSGIPSQHWTATDSLWKHEADVTMMKSP